MTNYIVKRTSPTEFGIFESFQSTTPVADGLRFDTATELVRAARLDPDFDLDYSLSYDAAEAAGEMYAEFAMNWVMGGGQSYDISAAWAQHGHRWNGVELVDA